MLKTFKFLFVFAIIIGALFGTATSCRASGEPLTNQQRMQRYDELCKKLDKQIDAMKSLLAQPAGKQLKDKLDSLRSKCLLLQDDYKSCLKGKGDRVVLNRIADEYITALDSLYTNLNEYHRYCGKLAVEIRLTLDDISELADNPSYFDKISPQQDYVDSVGREYHSHLSLVSEHKEQVSATLHKVLSPAEASAISPSDPLYIYARESAAHQVLRKKCE